MVEFNVTVTAAFWTVYTVPRNGITQIWMDVRFSYTTANFAAKSGQCPMEINSEDQWLIDEL